MEINQQYQPGEIVYIILRNPHAQDVAQIQQAAVVQNPKNHSELALFAHENYFPFSDEFAVFKTEESAEQAYTEAFGTPETGEFHG
ncbi:transcriptional regulator SplA domain-containing protein [Virgibacillus flavescens]|uniref:transcriptional regulator SplA domain-containing protein n=1 Tax=Virgibacillus flavescens TaxID=1611422 RepID=UPI003D333843